MKHLEFLTTNRIQNTSTAVHCWVDNMPATEDEKKWLKKTFDVLYNIERNYVVDPSINDDKETQEVMNKATATSKEWVKTVLDIHDRAEPAEKEEVIASPEPIPVPAPKKEIKETSHQDASNLATKLQEYLGTTSSRAITKSKLTDIGYQGAYPSGSKHITIENHFTIKRKSRAVTNRFILSKR